ncbi:MAG: dihydrolipoamide acetyltransferase family protein [Gemmatimonadetes bacterium]|nr:dihydrolipoamide acetyltransferase family protein [Gemmatimonadota bacterium]
MEALSPTMEEGQVTKWLKGEGDQVASGDTLAEVETDKAIMELVARGDGVLRKIVVPEGKTVDVGSLVAVIAASDEDISAMLGDTAAVAEAGSPNGAGTPAATTIAREPIATGHLKASPVARRIASERGVDLTTVHGSGPGGRIIKQDVETAVARPAAAPLGIGGFEDVPLTQMRKTIARRLGQSIGPVPHFFLTSEIDMEATVASRAALNALEDGPRISFNDILLKAVASALMQHRDCNAWWQDDYVRYFNEVHLGVAVAIDGGLITPVIRNAHTKTLRQIATEVRDLAGRAREKRLKPEEYTGSTFSVSNLGMFDIDQFTGVINPPEAALLAVGSIVEKPVVQEGQVMARKRMRVTMSCDHRVIDGATGARFLQTLRRMLENPLAMVW